ncbi:XRE family transcriptional regulator [Epilithonimonas mollis]|uniref:Helix-turn-helix n=1 Tax=Epilithonimonas mollis TaxID=216903 RepID=A0A1M6UJ08_9FLAO|nr:LexA family transcriptional regulator [Epilithonimonas mollis]SHK69161.1 Helix-turn-helix [Epilithonimonas mollis]
MLYIKDIREDKNLTQDDMVEKTGIPKRSYVSYENGEADIQLSKLRKIASVLDVTISELVENSKSDKKVIKSNDNKNDNFNDTKPNVKEKLSSIAETRSEYDAIIRKLKFADNVNLSEQGAPFYPLPVSAGTVSELHKEKYEATGFISMPGVSCKAYFPVIGCSFSDIIKPGDIIGIDFIDKWERLDPDCIYFIITHDQRMIKRLQDHPEDPEKLLCISPNYRDFPIWKSEIKVIHKVVFYGRLV